MYPERTAAPEALLTASDVMVLAQTSDATAGVMAGISSTTLKVSCKAM
jgi:hypothetical protein